MKRYLSFGLGMTFGLAACGGPGNSTDTTDMSEAESTADSSTGDGDGDATSGDGDGDATSGDGDGDGDDTTGDGDGDGDGLSCSIDCGLSDGAVTPLASGDDLQAAIDAAAPGDTLVLEAGATFLGNFVLREKAGVGCITIRTSTSDDQLDPANRVTPADAPLLARVISPGNGLPALRTEPGASHYRLIGLELAPEQPTSEVYTLVQLGSTGDDQTTLDLVPHHIVVDRCFVHGWPDANFKRGIGLDSADTCIVHSTISDFHSDFQDSQAIGGVNGPGPFEILDNRLEGSAENILFGGGVSAIPDLVPSDMLIQGNHFYKPLSWREGDPANTGYVPWVKNLFEIKNGRNVTFVGNLLENNWVGADQHGMAILLTPRSEDGAMPWATVEHIVIRDNHIVHVGGGVSILGYDTGMSSQQTNDIVIEGNLFEDVRQDYAFDTVRMIQFTQIAGLVIDHNTFAFDGPFDLVRSYGVATTGFEFTNNVVPYGTGVWSDCGTDQTALSCSLSDGEFTGNVVWGGGAGSLPPANGFAVDRDAVGFVDWAGGAADYHGYALAPDSVYAGSATDATNPGFSPDALDAAGL
jgi:hypothetical protein